MKLRLNLILGVVITVALVAIAAVGTFWTPFDPDAMSFTHRLLPPGPGGLLGTDDFGRDQFSRLMEGAATSLSISVLAVLLALALGLVVGLSAGFFGGWIDRTLSAVNDALLAFPAILLALTLLAVLGSGRWPMVAALGVAFAPSVARITRGIVRSLRNREYVEASLLMGNSGVYTLARHILPNCFAPLSALTTSMLGWALLSESALSFLGLGVAPPAPTWGNMLAASRSYLDQAPWLGIWPGLAITITLLGINLLADGLRDLTDPRMRLR